MNPLTMIDLSSNNGTVDLDELWHAGVRVIAFKATEGATYAWSGAAPLVHRWHDLGGIAGHYHYMRPGLVNEAHREARWFGDHVAPLLGVGSFLVVDHETKGETDAEVAAFIDVIHERFPHVPGLQYANRAFFGDAHIHRHHGWGLWVAAYGATNPGTTPTGWETWDAWQYTQSGSVPGVHGAVDESHIRRWLLEPVLRRDDRSWSVLRLKHELHQAGYRRFNTDSNHYGAGTARAVLKFKTDHRRVFGRRASGAVAGRTMWRTLDRVAAG